MHVSPIAHAKARWFASDQTRADWVRYLADADAARAAHPIPAAIVAADRAARIARHTYLFDLDNPEVTVATLAHDRHTAIEATRLSDRLHLGADT